MAPPSSYVEYFEQVSLSCSYFNKRIDKSLAMSKRLMQDKRQGEDAECVVAKSRLARNFVAWAPIRCPTAPSSSSAVHSPGNPRASCPTLGSSSTERPEAVDSNASNASSSEVWPASTDTSRSTVSPVATPKMRPTIRDLAHHNFAVLQQNLTLCGEKVFDSLRQKLGRRRGRLWSKSTLTFRKRGCS